MEVGRVPSQQQNQRNELAIGLLTRPGMWLILVLLDEWKVPQTGLHGGGTNWNLRALGLLQSPGGEHFLLASQLCIEEDVRQYPSDEQNVTMIEESFRCSKVPGKRNDRMGLDTIFKWQIILVGRTHIERVTIHLSF